MQATYAMRTATLSTRLSSDCSEIQHEDNPNAGVFVISFSLLPARSTQNRHEAACSKLIKNCSELCDVTSNLVDAGDDDVGMPTLQESEW